MRVLVATKRRTIITIGILTLCIGTLDYLLGERLDLFALHVLPVALAGWYLDGVAALGVSVIAMLVWLLDDSVSTGLVLNTTMLYWDAAVRLISMSGFGLLLAKLHTALLQERAMRHKLTGALEEIQQLKGFLSICAGCKSIRHDDGHWEQIERYIGARAPVAFSHGLCPACTRRLYPDLYPDDEPLT